MNCLIVKFIPAIAVAVLVGAHSAFAGGPYYLAADASNKKDVAFDIVGSWLDEDGNAYQGDTVFDPDASYFVSDGRVLTTRYGGENVPDTVFSGKSLTFGSVQNGKKGYFYIYQSGNYKIAFTKLILEKGEVNHNYLHNARNTIDGDVEVRSVAADPFKFINYYANCRDIWTGDFSGGSDAVFMIGGAANTGYVFQATGTWTEYQGKLIVRNPKTEGAITFRPQTSSSFPGTLAMEPLTVLSPLNATDVVTVKNLELSGNAKIIVAGSVSSASRIVASEGFSQTGKVLLDVTSLLPSVTDAGSTNTIICVPADASLSADDFILDDDVLAKNGYLTVDESGEGVKRLNLVFNRVVAQTVTDSSSSVKHQERNVASSLLDATHWSDRELPHAGVDYIVKPDADNKAVHLFAPQQDYEFQGDRLIFKPWCYFHLAGPRFTAPRLVFDGSNNRMWLTTALEDGAVVDGGVVDVRSSALNLGIWKNYLLKIDSEIIGSGNIVMQGVDSTSDFDGKAWFTALNTNFTGTISVSMYAAWTPTPGKCQTLFISDGRNLGGFRSAMDYKALSLSRYGCLAVTNADEVVLAGGVNRGVYVDGKAQMRVGMHDGKASSLVLERPLTLNGELLKDGPGALTLASEVRYGSESGDEPVAGSNLLTVNGGSVVVASGACVDGVSMTFAEGTRLVVKADPENAEWTAEGVRNLKSAAPFALGEGMMRLPVSIDLSAVSDDTLKKGFTCAIATVSAAAADSVASMLYGRISGGESVSSGFINRVVDAAAGTVTFSATFKPRGLVLTVK